ncbi:MAG: hypothetical protein AAF496_11845 [Pseudomonadota bacterium]
MLRSKWGVGDQLYLNRILGNGRSGAMVYVADVSCPEFTGQAILKLERVSDSGTQEKLEGDLHAQAIKDAPQFAEQHLPRIIHSLHDMEAIAILSTIAGRGLEYADSWYDVPYDLQLGVTRQISRALLEDWNDDYDLSSGLLTPQDLLKSWLGYRLDPSQGGRVHEFMRDTCNISPQTPSILYNGHWYPNPLAFYDQSVETPQNQLLRGVIGRVHNDLHGFNVLVGRPKYSEPEAETQFYLIDLAMYQPRQYLLFDHAYFEFTALLKNRGENSAEAWEAVIAQVRRYRDDVDHGLRTDDLGLVEIVQTIRHGVSDWINAHESERLSSLESQQILARVAVGLSFVHKRLPDDIRKKALYYAAANLKDYLKLHRIKWPKSGQELVIEPAMQPSLPVDAAPSETVDKARVPDASANAAPAARSKRKQAIGLALRVAIVVAIGIAGFFYKTHIAPVNSLTTDDFVTALSSDTAADAKKISVAVLPFSNEGQYDEDSFADGMTIEVINALARTGHFRVPGFASVSKFLGQNDGIEKVGDELNVDYVVEGDVTHVQDQMRTRISLFDSASGDLVWNGKFDESVADEKKAEEVAFAIGDALSISMEVTSEQSVAEQALDPQAYAAYVRGIALLEQRGEALVRSTAALKRAVEIQPDFAVAWAALSIAYNVLPTYLREAEGDKVRPTVYYRLSKEASEKAFEINPNLSEVQHAMANVLQRDRQWVSAEEAYQRSLELDPYNHRAMQDYAGLLATVGKPRVGLELLERAKALDPNNDLYWMMTARMAYLINPSDVNLEQIETVFREAPTFRELAFRMILAARVGRDEIDSARALIASCATCTQVFQSRALALIDAANILPIEQIYDDYRDEVYLSYSYLYRYGGIDVAMDLFEYNALESNYRLQFFTAPWGMVGIFGTNDRFERIIELMGLEDYWKENGWSPMCKPAEDGPECFKL